jgi:two-component system, NtrC family, response regulator AtoC
MNILCVDDDPFMLKFFEEAVLKLELPGVEVLTAVTGQSALDIAERKQIDIVILDKKLPDISGIDVLRKIRQLRMATEVLMVTGHGSVETAVEAMNAGARDYIEKPVRLVLLHEKVLNIVELIKRGSEAEEYRHAKETIEAGAQRNITSLEQVISSMKECQQRVMGIIESPASDREKVHRIRQEIQGLKNGTK